MEASAAPWAELRSETDRFAVALPGTPSETSEQHATLAGRVSSRAYAGRDGEAEYRVEVHRIPRVARFLLSEAALLERARDDLVEAEGGELLASATESVAGRPGSAVAYRAAEGRRGAARLVLVGRRLYVLAVLWPAAGPRADLARFFGSFEAW